MFDKDPIRLNKYISESGICSRRQADKYIQHGNVLLNGKKAKVGDKVFPGDQVVVNGQAIEPRKAEDAIFLAFNKPVGIISTTEANVKNNIVDYVNYPERIFPIGRLDKDSQGLIFLTSNGDIVNKILRAGNEHEKEYIVTVNKALTDQFIEGMARGVPVLGGTTKKCVVEQESLFVFRITLIQGMNRQIRRMCEYFNYEVTKLERVRIMNVSLKGLPLGDWRELTKEELAGILKLIKNSTSTEDNHPSSRNTKKVSHRDERPHRENVNEGKSHGSGHPKPRPEDRLFKRSGRTGGSRGKNKSSGRNKKRDTKGRSGGRGRRGR